MSSFNFRPWYTTPQEQDLICYDWMASFTCRTFWILVYYGASPQVGTGKLKLHLAAWTMKVQTRNQFEVKRESPIIPKETCFCFAVSCHPPQSWLCHYLRQVTFWSVRSYARWPPCWHLFNSFSSPPLISFSRSLSEYIAEFSFCLVVTAMYLCNKSWSRVPSIICGCSC